MFENIITETKGRVGIITLNRPKALNALCQQLTEEMGDALAAFEVDANIACVILTGSEKAFAAGADIKEMQPKNYMDVYKEDFITATWEAVAKFRKPIIAAVSGYALGGGCEMAMMCDIILAADTAKFGQPEITIGTIPGAGGTQRLTHAIGKSKAMEMCLTGRMMGAEEAERSGLVAKVVPADQLLEEAHKMAATIAEKSIPVSMLTKECVNAAYDLSLKQGLQFERRLFHSTFSLKDREEGMQAFVEKRKPDFKDC